MTAFNAQEGTVWTYTPAIEYVKDRLLIFVVLGTPDNHRRCYFDLITGKQSYFWIDSRVNINSERIF
jgi:hypothetical protein